ncbi:MAG TPA: hypothetical protein DEW46_12395, partial [Verrucomicrobia bacterium]|nr:hypothetical protein [Verrucomicrobiota bacterium]
MDLHSPPPYSLPSAPPRLCESPPHPDPESLPQRARWRFRLATGVGWIHALIQAVLLGNSGM